MHCIEFCHHSSFSHLRFSVNLTSFMKTHVCEFRLHSQFNYQMRLTFQSMSRINQQYHFSRLCLFCVQFFYLIQAKETCYWPDGSQAEEYFACHEGDSPCCRDGEICLSNSLCYVAALGKVSVSGLFGIADFLDF